MSEVKKALILLVKKEGSQSAAARKLGTTRQLVNALLKGTKNFSEKMANNLGYKKVVTWKKISRD